MSYMQLKLCIKILNEYFGPTVTKVGEILMNNYYTSFKDLKEESKLSQLKVQEVLCVLIKHNLVEWTDIKPGLPGYNIFSRRILLFLRYHRYLSIIKELHGDIAEILVDIILKEGRATASHAIITYCLKHYEASENDVSGRDQHLEARNTFIKLVDNQFIQRCSYPDDNKITPQFSILEDELYKFLPSFLNLKLIISEIERKKKLPETDNTRDESKHPDNNIYWRLNIDRFHLEMRDNEIRKSISRLINPSASECIRALLKASYLRSDPWSSTLNPVTVCDIKGQQIDIPFVEQYLKKIMDNGKGFLNKVGDAGGGEYVANMKSIIEAIVVSHVENIVRERFGSKSARIFKLVKEKGIMEQITINRLAMIESKEGNALMYRLHKERFLEIYELRKTLTPTPATKSLYMYKVNINAIILKMEQWTMQALYNLILSREATINENKRLLEKKTKIEVIVFSYQESGAPKDQIEDVEETMTDVESDLCKRLNESTDKIHGAQSYLDESLFLFEMYTIYKRRS